MTYRENINGLLARQRTNLGQRRKNTADLINFQKEQQKELEDNIGKATDLLVGDPARAFGSGLSGQGFQTEGEGIFPTLYGEHVKRKREEGAEAADKDRAERLEHMVKHFERLRETDTAHHSVKRKMLLNGAYYDDADRFTKLSPHAQVGYAQQKLNLYKESFADKLNHWMARNQQEYNFNNNIVTPESIHNNHQYPLLIKEHLLNKGIEEISKQNGIDGFSDDMLTLAGINDFTDPDTGNITQGVHNKTKADIMAKYRKNYNVEASAKLRIEHFNELMSDPTAPGSINRFLIKVGTTTDENNQLLSWSGGWRELQNLLIDMYAAGKIQEKEIRAMFQQEIPGRPGKTYAEEYPGRLGDIIRKSKEKAEANINADLKASDNAAQRVEIEFKQKMEPGGELDQWVKEYGKLPQSVIDYYQKRWEDAGGRNDGQTPTFLTNVVTREEQDQQAIIDNVKDLLAPGNRGYITAYDVRNATADTMATIKQLPGYNSNTNNAINSGEQFRKYGVDQGFESVLERGLTSFLKLDADEPKPWNWDDLYTNLENEYFTTYRNLLDAGKLSPAAAHTAALQDVQRRMGLRPGPDGNLVSRADAEKFVRKPNNAPDLEELKRSNQYQARRIDAGKNLIDKIMKARGEGPLPDLNVLLPGAGVESKDWQDAALFADTKGRKGKISDYYSSLARLFPQFTVEDLVNWQLQAGGHEGLYSSSFNESLKVEGLEELHRIIGYKPTPATTIQGKVQAIDASTMLRHASLRAELNLEQPVRAPDDPTLIADKERLSGLISTEQQEADVEKYGHSGIPPNPDDYKNNRGRWKPGGQAKYNAELQKYEKYKLEYELDNPPELGQGDPSSVWETKIIYKGTSVRNQKPVTVYRRLGDKEWSEEIPEGYVPPAEDVSYLQSHFYRYDSPILAPYLVDYSVALFNEKVLNATAV